jgi:septum formation protein
VTGEHKNNRLILGSGSIYRAEMLHNAGVEFSVIRPDIDERAVEQPLLEAGLDSAAIAEILARTKAETLSQKHPGAYVIGSDQTLALDGEMLHKPTTMEEARRRLLKLSGQTHHLHSAVCLARDGQTLWSHVETASIRFRDLTPQFIGRHLAAAGEIALTSVGAYQIEGLGIQLVESVEGDFFSIRGMPLIALLDELRKRKLLEDSGI